MNSAEPAPHPQYVDDPFRNSMRASMGNLGTPRHPLYFIEALISKFELRLQHSQPYNHTAIQLS